MAWTNIPLSHIALGLFSGSTVGATVNVAAADLLLFRYKKLSADTVVVDFRIGKAFFNPSSAGVAGITMELNIPFSSVHFPALGSPSSFNDGGQAYSNDCVIASDPGGLAHVPACVTVLNESSHKVVLLVRNVSGTNINTVGVVGFFGQITFEVAPRKHKPFVRSKASRTSSRGVSKRARKRNV